jgi:SNF2 family DNA or RNA helicase
VGVPATNWTPANLKVLELALDHARRGDRVLIGSSLIETGRWLADRLKERGVRAVHIVEERDGRAHTKNPRKRSAEIKAFKQGAAQVLCCGVQAVKLGHNLDQVNTVIVHGLPWTHLALKQFVDRAWRLTSRRDVTVWVIVPRVEGSQTIAERKWQLVLDKGAASDLALDGQLIDKPEQKVDWGMTDGRHRRHRVAP